MTILTWSQALAVACLVFVAAVLLMEAIKARRAYPWHRGVNRRRPGVLDKPADACQRNKTEAVPQ